VAAGLADALLAGPPTLESAVDRCALALDARPGWLRPLATYLLTGFGERWHWNVRRELIAAIAASEPFGRAWETEPWPRLVRPFLDAPAAAPAPPWLTEPLPDLATAAALAGFLGLDTLRLEGLLQSLRYRDPDPGFRRLDHYHYRWLEKRTGGHRLLEVPKPRLRDIQRRLLRGLLDRVPPYPAAHGFRPGHSALTHAREHAGQVVVVRLDLADFFLHVGAARVLAIFRRLGYPDSAADRLALLCTHRTPGAVLDPGRLPGERPSGFRGGRIDAGRYRSPHLPQGAPTSPALANLAAFGLDLRLAATAKSAGARYTRYADDLAFSGGEDFRRSVGRFIPWVGSIVADEGFAVNFRKTRVMSKGLRQRVTGLVVNARPNVPREDFDRIKAILTNCIRHGPLSQTSLPPARFRSTLAGHIAYIGASNPGRGERLRLLFEGIRWDEIDGPR
jgi:hypothetical protein